MPPSNATEFNILSSRGREMASTRGPAMCRPREVRQQAVEDWRTRLGSSAQFSPTRMVSESTRTSPSRLRVPIAKVVVVGDSGVGKTALVAELLDDIGSN